MQERRLLLISSSRTHGTGFLEHCREHILRRLDGVQELLFVPYALADRDSYANLAREAFSSCGCRITAIHQVDDAHQAVQEAAAMFVGGGNSFRLLKALYDADLLSLIRQRVREGMPYLGASAGTNLACPTIRTTNDMPIVEPPSLAALNLIPFQINPHFVDADPQSTHQGESRETRIREFLEENTTPVIGLREGSCLWIDQDRCELLGSPAPYYSGRKRQPKNFQRAPCWIFPVNRYGNADMNPRCVCIVAADFNKTLVDAMIEAATKVLDERPEYAVRVVRVPGAYELPIVADTEVSRREVLGLVVLGYIERGETMHGEVMGHVVHAKLVDIQLASKKPMGLGIIGPGATMEQASARHREYAAAASRALLRVLDVLRDHRA